MFKCSIPTSIPKEQLHEWSIEVKAEATLFFLLTEYVMTLLGKVEGGEAY